MAGMLPGVEAARRRRVHQSCGCSSHGITSSYSPSRRSTFSLFSPNNSSTSFSAQPRSSTYQDDEKLGPLAREARNRLDEKLRAQRKPIFTMNNNDHMRSKGENIKNELRTTEVYGSASGAKGLIIGCAKLGWKTGEQHECFMFC